MFNNSIGGSEMLLSERLKAAREARGWTVEEVGAQLKLPARVIARVERGEFEDLGAPIYRRGYLRSFARLVGVHAGDVDQALEQMGGEAPALVATGVMARGDYVSERYLRPATYIALTALIALPVVWWAASGRLGQELAAGAGQLDLHPQAMLSGSGDRGRSGGEASEGSAGEVVRASLMPLPKDTVRDLVMPEPTLSSAGGEGDADEAAEPNDAEGLASEVIGSGRRHVVLELAAPSWVEVVAADGRRLQQALLQPGQWQYRSDGPLSFTIGNSRSARLQVDGETMDLATHRTSNDVVRLRLFSDEG